MSHSQNNPNRASGNRAPAKERGAVGLHRSVRHVKKCPIGTLVSYAKVDGTCRNVENYRHAWLPDGTCGNCDMTREEAGYTPRWHELLARKKKGPNESKLSHAGDSMKTDIKSQMNAEKPDDMLADLEAKHRLAATASSTTDRTLTLAQDFCERTISDLNSGKATLRYETLEAFEKLCTQCGISTIRIQS